MLQKLQSYDSVVGQSIILDDSAAGWLWEREESIHLVRVKDLVDTVLMSTASIETETNLQGTVITRLQ